MRVANEVKVGIVVVIAALLTVFGYFFLRGVGLGADLYYLRVKGPAAIAAGNDVRLQGVKVGQVQEVVLDDETQKPLLTLAVRRHNKLLKTYTYAISSSALIGESYVDIRGPYDPTVARYEPNRTDEIIPGEMPTGLGRVTDEATELMKDFRVTLGKFNVTIDRVNKGVLSYENQIKLARTLDNVTKLTERVGQAFGPEGVRFGFGDPRARESLNRALEGAAATTKNLDSVTTNINAIMAENRSQLHDLLGNLSRASTDVAGLAETLRFVANHGNLQENVAGAFKSLRAAADNMEATTKNVRTLTADPATTRDIREMLTALRQATESLRDTAGTIKGAVGDPGTQGQIKDIITTLRTTVGTLQATTENLRDASAGFKNVVGDPQVQSDLKAIPAELRGTLVAARATAERIDALLGGRRHRNAPAAGGGVASQRQGYAPGGFDFTYRRWLSVDGGPRTGADLTGRNYGDLDFRSEFFGRPFRLGIAGIGDGNDITAQTGSFMGRDGSLRYGLYRSKLGVGADWHQNRFSLEGNWWDPNNRSWNAFLGYRVHPQAEIFVGREQIRGVRSNTVGVRLSP